MMTVDGERVGCLSGDKEVVMVVGDEEDEDERGHAGDHGEEGLHLGWLSPNLGNHHAERPLCPPHLVVPSVTSRSSPLRTKNTPVFFPFCFPYFSRAFFGTTDRPRLWAGNLAHGRFFGDGGLCNVIMVTDDFLCYY
jgi:hypothetical protein